MPSLDGYSLNEKIDNTYEEVRADIVQLQKDFHRLYQIISEIEAKKGAKVEEGKKKQTKKAKVAKVAEVSE